jgi:hypothetical protein
LIDPLRLETGVRLAICDSLSLATVVWLNDLVASALESQNRKPERGLVFCLLYLWERLGEGAKLSGFRKVLIRPSTVTIDGNRETVDAKFGHEISFWSAQSLRSDSVGVRTFLITLMMSKS